MTEKEMWTRVDVLEKITRDKQKKFDFIKCKSFAEFDELTAVEDKELGQLSRKIRMIEKVELTELSNNGDVMSLDSFIENVKYGGFIDYDGYGHYISEGKDTNIDILPSDITHRMYRKEFNKIIWFNR